MGESQSTRVCMSNLLQVYQRHRRYNVTEDGATGDLPSITRPVQAHPKHIVRSRLSPPSNSVPHTDTERRRVNVNVPVPQNLHLGTVDPQTGTWELTDKSLGAGVTVGPHGAQLLTATPSTVR